MNNRVKKVIVWRILSTLIAILVTYIFLGEVHKTLEVVITLTVVMTTLHYYYEKWWENIQKRNKNVS